MSYSASRSIAKQRAYESLVFYPRKMAPETSQYVCWVDVMGSKEIMVRSLNVASNFLMKLHIAALKVSEEFSIELYPVIDGLYACSPSQSQILSFINRVHSMLAVTFVLENTQLFKFQVRTGLAYGPVVTGRQVLRCSRVLQNHPSHTKSVLLGSALANAFQAENEAAPFGVALHESVISKVGEIFLSGSHLKWWEICSRPNDFFLACELYHSLQEHYAWCSRKSSYLGYEIDAINKHKAKVDEYFAECIRSKPSKNQGINLFDYAFRY